MIKIGDIAIIGNSKTYCRVLSIDLNFKCKVDLGYRIANHNLKALHLANSQNIILPITKSQAIKEKTEARQEKRLLQDHLSKTAEYKPLYKTSFRKFCYKKNFIKGL